MRRCLTIQAVFTVVLTMAVRPTSVQADGINSTKTATYSLTIPGGLPDPGPDVNHVNSGVSLPQLEAKVVPAGGIVPPTLPDGSQGSPLTIESDSFGFDKDHLVVALNNNPQDATDQKFGLVFFNGGLAANNLLHFSLNINDALSTPPALEITSPGSLSGRTLTALAKTPDPVPPPPDHGSVNIPEPMSVLVWSALAGFGLVRARGLRRSSKLCPA
ncbi:hypothetical protein SAMN05444166_4442 [Singulisphaera sp. GP187]|uniref:hypothetical protein n=1 Tax=Singulisphaera sp. GP187 TaxID=1882752 RepID=UPI000926898F|nr:hypothetical protein [Singulisphaera sp. GP187]SIO40631.1 hypothetical protein SAMN05444166_4442 [Singulisphaera sp. GP187]